MKKQLTYFILFLFSFNFYVAKAQESEKKASEINSKILFLDQNQLAIKMSFSVKNLKKKTNDSTYVPSKMMYQLQDSSWHTIDINLRVRGNYRLKNCYFPPLKIKINKEVSKNTMFEGNKSLKIIMPCLIQKDCNDNVIKELIAYKLYEVISPHHFKTRLLDFSFEEIKKNKSKMHQLKAVFIENNSAVASRIGGKIHKPFIHPRRQDAISSIRHAFFQFMIGNTDFSQAYMHNVKVFYIDKKMIPIPYDFDMSGLINSSYAVVSQINNQKLNAHSVTQRIYRGFSRDYKQLDQVRQEFMAHKNEMLTILDNHTHYFSNPKEFTKAKDYIISFFDIIEDDKSYKRAIVDKARKM